MMAPRGVRPGIYRCERELRATTQRVLGQHRVRPRHDGVGLSPMMSFVIEEMRKDRATPLGLSMTLDFIAEHLLTCGLGQILNVSNDPGVLGSEAQAIAVFRPHRARPARPP
jgi:hypothetical protein